MNTNPKVISSVTFCSGSDFTLPLLKRLHALYPKALSIITKPDTIHRGVTYTNAIASYAKKNSIPLWQPKTLRHITANELSDYIPKTDNAVIASYGLIIPSALLNYFTYGCINWHPSLLPKYRGPTPVQTALKNGESHTGLTWIQMDEGVDSGPIILQKKIDIQESDTTQTILDKAIEIGCETLTEALIHSAEKKYKAQDNEKATTTTLLKKYSGEIQQKSIQEWKTKEIIQLIHAYTPYPRVYLHHPVHGMIRIESYSITHPIGWLVPNQDHSIPLYITQATNNKGVRLTSKQLSEHVL